mmetsp:Transcript_34581/g.80685  ORF Transcript_34581/g.80685 Transcript_34581/m.80685 type:complete len:124 (-) Transcript_34581:618-989(-)
MLVRERSSVSNAGPSLVSVGEAIAESIASAVSSMVMFAKSAGQENRFAASTSATNIAMAVTSMSFHVECVGAQSQFASSSTATTTATAVGGILGRIRSLRVTFSPGLSWPCQLLEHFPPLPTV